ncbi:hypothetical protein HYR99_18850 [Candidatus Poribacteria bacterium]|nr:hypothetical protein [Candidatus Poribacteria bacterium]
MTKAKLKGVSLRALIIASILIPPNSYWIMQTEMAWYSGRPTILSLFFNVIFCIFVLVLLNALWGKFSPKTALNQCELIVIFIMLSSASAVAGWDMIQALVPVLGHAFWYATPENEWKELFWRYLPTWLTVRDAAALSEYYEGNSTLYTARNIKSWVTPVLSWSGFIIALVFVMVCLNVVIRRQWTEAEKLRYPVIQLPYEMTRPGFLRSKLLWTAFLIAGSIDLINGLSTFYPTLPTIPVKRHDIGYLFPGKPWSAIGWTPISFYPFAIGMGFFIPLDLSFSCWFFYLFWKVQRVLADLAGLRSLPQFPYVNEQAFGIYIGLVMVVLWMARTHLKQVLKRVFGGTSELNDSEEPLRYRSAFWGIVCGMAFILLFWHTGGMSLWVAWVYFLIYFAIISLAITRIRAELGTPVNDFYYSTGWTGPDAIMVSVFGTKRFTPEDLTMFSLLFGINRGFYRCHPMPHQLEGFKLAERVQMKNKKLVFAILLATILGTLSAFWAFLHIAYRTPGGVVGSFTGPQAFSQLQAWLSRPIHTDYPAVAFIGIGLMLSFCLMAMRTRFLWWPLHPAGYALSASWTMNMLWLPLFFSWATKAVLLRYGGLKAHRQAVPFFLGLILGEFIMGSFWSLFCVILGRPTYTFWI